MDNNNSSYIWPPKYNINRKATLPEIFNEYFNLLNRKQMKTHINNLSIDQSKDLSISESYRSTGIYCMEIGFYLQALYYINGALIYAPVQHEIYGLGLELRSEVLFSLEKYVECLADIEQIQSINCPNYYFYKILIRKCCCYRNLRQYEDAWNALEEAKLAFHCTNELVADKTKDVKSKLTWLENDLRHILDSNPNIRVTMPRNELPPLPLLLNGENEQFLNASNSLYLWDNNRFGRFVFAKKPIKKGSVLFVEEPYAISNTFVNNHSLYYCSNCVTTTIAIIPCSGCIQMYYCSVNCKEIHWNLRHRWECAGLRRNILSPTMQLALGILFRASFSNFKDKTIYNIFGDIVDNYAYIQTLEINLNKIPAKTIKLLLKQSCWMIIYLRYFTNYFWWLRNQYPHEWRSTKVATQTLGTYLFSHLCLIYYHAEMIGDFYPGSSSDFFQGLFYMRKTLALYVSSRLIRHSCLPNTIASFEGLTKIIRATRDISVGEVISISYFDKSVQTAAYELPLAHNLRQFFIKRSLYSCKCIYCTDSSLSRKMYCYKCPSCYDYATIQNNNNAKCVRCDKEFPLSHYKDKQILLNVAYANMKNRKLSIYDLDQLQKRMREIFHSFNLNFIYLFAHYAYYYEYKENYLKVAQCIENMRQIRKIWFGESDQIYAAYSVSYTVSYVKHFLTVRNTDVYDRKIERPLKKRVRQALQKTMTILEMHMSNETIRAFEKIVIDILESRKFIFPSQVENMIFYHTSKTPVLIKLYDSVRISESIYVI